MRKNNPLKAPIQILCLLAITLGLVGCNTTAGLKVYPGEAEEFKNSAVIMHKPKGTGYFIVYESIESSAYKYKAGAARVPLFFKPGEYELTLNVGTTNLEWRAIRSGQKSNRKHLSVVLEEGMVYYIEPNLVKNDSSKQINPMISVLGQGGTWNPELVEVGTIAETRELFESQEFRVPKWMGLNESVDSYKFIKYGKFVDK